MIQMENLFNFRVNMFQEIKANSCQVCIQLYNFKFYNLT